MSISVSGSLVGASAPFGVADTAGTTLPSDPTPSYSEPIAGYTSTDTVGWMTELDGTNDYWERTDNDYGAILNASIEATWLGGGSKLAYLVSRHNSDRMYLALDTSNKVMFGNGTNAAQSKTTFDPTKINHVKLTADGVNVKFYVNGALIATQTQNFSGTLDNVGFGRRGDGGGYLNANLLSARVVTDYETDTYIFDTDADVVLKQATALGAEELLDPSFDTGTPWITSCAGTGTFGFSGGLLTVTGPNYANRGEVKQSLTLKTNTLYSITYDCITDNNAYIILYINGSTTTADAYNVPAAGTHTIIREFAHTDVRVHLRSQGGASVFGEISVKEITLEGGTVALGADPDTELTLTNAVSDGSNRERLARKPDNSGWDRLVGKPELLTDNSPLASATSRSLLGAGNVGVSVRVINALGISWHDDVSVVAFISNDEVVTIRSGGNGVLNLYNQGAEAFDLVTCSAKEQLVPAVYDYAAGANP